MTNRWQYSNYSKVDEEVKKQFPFEKPRKYQLETISEIKQAIDKGYKYIVLEAGTGTGKSVIAATLSSMYESSYILTVTKQLQNQYLNDFDDLGFKLVKGRANFTCKKYLEDNIEQGCDEGRCVLEGYRCDYSNRNKPRHCDYYVQKWTALESNVVISNYPYMFLELNYNQEFKERRLLICDEAHNIENIIMNQLKLEFKRNELKEYVGIKLSKDLTRKLSNGDYTDWIQFIKRVTDNYEKELNRIKSLKNKKGIKEKIHFIKKRLSDCYRFIGHIKQNPIIWICDYNPYYGVIAFKPLKVDKYAKNTLFDYADVCLFMSATILDYKLFAKWLGINENEIYAIRRESPFDIARNPIKTYDNYNLAYKNLQSNAPKTINSIKGILENHKNDKGIIHTISHSCKKFLKKEINNPRLIDHDTSNRSERLDQFKRSKKPLVLISPSMNEGVDLPGNQCRFQIIYKIPFPSLGDKQTAKRKKIDPQWFEYKTALALVQIYGRGMRYEKDYCKTYFMDNRLNSFVRGDEKTNNFLPDFFKKAINITPAPIDENEIPDEPSGTEISTNEELIDLKYNLILKGENLIDNNRYDDALIFYAKLLNHTLFVNDYYPYKMISRVYRLLNQFSLEVDILKTFFKSGVYCNGREFRWFKRRLKQLSKNGFFDFNKMPELEEKFNKKGALNENLSNKPVDNAFKIKNDKHDISTSDLKSQKYDLILKAEKLFNNNQYEKTIIFLNTLLENDLFENDYYPYKRLARIFHINDQFNDEVKIIVKFFKSGIYCDEKEFRWFKRRLKQLSKNGLFDFTKMCKLEEEFNKNGALNKNLSNKPVINAFELINKK